MIEMEVAHRHDVHAGRIEAGRAHRRHDRIALDLAHVAHLVRDPLADARLDEDAPGRRLDQEAVERLLEAVLGVDLVGRQPIPDDPRHGPEQRPGIRTERAGLDQPDARSAAEVERPVHRVVHHHRGPAAAARVSVRTWSCWTTWACRAPAGPRRSRGGRPRPSVRTGPGTWSPDRRNRTAARPGSTS